MKGEQIASRLILHIVYRFSTGGLENGVVNLINRLPANRWRHGVVALTEVSAMFQARIERSDTLFIGLDKGPGHAVKLYPQLFRLFRELRPAIVHTRNLAALEASIPATLAGVPVRVHGEHGRDVEDLDGLNRKYQWMRRIYSPFVTRYIALSADLEDYLRTRVGIAPQRIEQIYNGVDTQRFYPSTNGRAMIRGCPFQDPSLWLVGSVGRLVGMKDPVNLARAFLHALDLHPAARQRMRLVVVGDGALRGEFEQLLRDAGALDLAWFAGDRRDVSDIMRGLDCFVLPSLVEGVSNAILEAMASGLPIVATRVGGNAELIEQGMTGRIVTRADHTALASEIVAYFAEPATARQHGRAGRDRVERGFSLDRMVERYSVLYSNILGLDRAESAPAGRVPREPAQG